MKIFTISLLYIFCFTSNSKADSDTLLIKLKTGKSDKIVIDKIRSIKFEIASDVKDSPNTFLVLKDNYPNPFNNETTIEFDLLVPSDIKINIFDSKGELINTLICESCKIGRNSLIWNGLNSKNNRVESGTYFYEINVGDVLLSKKMLLIK
ncbi:MAG: T9SS type A sorting domain-containing protein [Candidatus Kapabacteria bacterium]|nr:T9SS type A sorting domain-containing protein [Candidatus Kapabacteria bacterium]